MESGFRSGRGRVVRIVLLLAAAVASVALTAPSYADSEYGMRAVQNGGGTVDGIASNITLDGVGPTPSTCIIFSAVSGIPNYQVQAGWVRCGSNAYLDKNRCGTATDPVTGHSPIIAFVETQVGDAYDCYQGGTGVIGSTANFQARQADDNADYRGFVNSVGFGPTIHFSTDPSIAIWGEETHDGLTGCSGWTGSGIFKGTQLYHRGDGYHYFNTFPTVDWYEAPGIGGWPPSPPCWSYGAWTGATGSAHIFKTS